MPRLDFVALMAVFTGCALQNSDRVNQRWVTTYYDRNHAEPWISRCILLAPVMPTPIGLWSTPGFRGRYDLRINFGFVPEKKRVNVLVPKDVKITLGQPPFLPAQ